jgi:hypothetical protein
MYGHGSGYSQMGYPYNYQGSSSSGAHGATGSSSYYGAGAGAAAAAASKYDSSLGPDETLFYNSRPIMPDSDFKSASLSRDGRLRDSWFSEISSYKPPPPIPGETFISILYL